MKSQRGRVSYEQKWNEKTYQIRRKQKHEIPARKREKKEKQKKLKQRQA